RCLLFTARRRRLTSRWRKMIRKRGTTKHTKDTKGSPQSRRVGRVFETHQRAFPGGSRRLDPPYKTFFCLFSVYSVCFVVPLFFLLARLLLPPRSPGGESLFPLVGVGTGLWPQVGAGDGLERGVRRPLHQRFLVLQQADQVRHQLLFVPLTGGQ